MPSPEVFFGAAASLARAHYPALILSALLLGVSAAFSGCETSLFSLSAPELNRIRTGRNRLSRTIARLHASLKTLLPTILFCNMAVNVMIYALSAGIVSDAGRRYGAGAAAACSLASLFVVVFFGEVFPKQLAISSSSLVARLTAFPVWAVYRVLGAPMKILNAVVTAFERIADANPADSTELREEELRLLVELSRRDGVISAGEYELIDGIVDLPEVRIRDIMVPRVDVPALPPDAGAEEILAAARAGGHSKMPVLSDDRGDLAGWVDAREVYAKALRSTGLDAERFLRSFQFFSEHDRADQVLQRVKGDSGGLFAVVDERGQIIGFFTLQDIMDEILGHFGENGAPPAQEIREADGRYLVSGRMAVREWRELFNVTDALPRSATVGGLIVSLLGRLAQPGDTVRLSSMEITVTGTRRNRVTEAAIRLHRPEDAAAAGAQAEREEE